MPKSVMLLDQRLSAKGMIALSIYCQRIPITNQIAIILHSISPSFSHHLSLHWSLRLVITIYFPFFFTIGLEENNPDSRWALELDWESNCHFLSDKVLICPGGKERLDVSVDKWTQGQSWQGAAGDKMPSATGLYFYPTSQLERCRSHIPEQQGFESGYAADKCSYSFF